MSTARKRLEHRIRRHLRVRRKVSGTQERPRLAIFRSLKHVYVQVIDDVTGKTLASASTLTPELRQKLGKKTGNVAASKEVGKLVATRAKEKGVKKVAFDRAGYKYHGRVKALADAAREAGLEF
jgi:large subunit ribosomal protein L18